MVWWCTGQGSWLDWVVLFHLSDSVTLRSKVPSRTEGLSQYRAKTFLDGSKRV